MTNGGRVAALALATLFAACSGAGSSGSDGGAGDGNDGKGQGDGKVGDGGSSDAKDGAGGTGGGGGAGGTGGGSGGAGGGSGGTGGSTDGGAGEGGSDVSPEVLPADPYQEIFDEVDPARLETTLREMTGYLPVTVDGKTVMITDRYDPAMKRNFRAYWRAFMEDLGLPVEEMTYTTAHDIGETEGHNLEAVLVGKSKDSVINIVHYDSIGEFGKETENPGVDDDMTGMAIMLEAARLLVPRVSRLSYTVRFVASDYEEQPDPDLEGARKYAKLIEGRAASGGFSLVAGVDHEQTGWNCSKDGGPCSDALGGTIFNIYSCSGDSADYKFPMLGDVMESITTKYSTLDVHRDCLGANSDHYALWEIGVPTVVYAEHEVLENPHFDRSGGDTIDKIDFTYWTKIARVGVTFAAKMAVVDGK